MSSGWIGVDLDGTLAKYDGWIGVHYIGEPILPMVRRVKAWIEADKVVKIFTARVSKYSGSEKEQRDINETKKYISKWLKEECGIEKDLEITCEKDYGMIELWDDRCIQVIPNTGERADGRKE